VIERVERIAILLDFYGGLLTDKQQQCMDLHYNQDMSLAEIAEIYAVSRQAVHDILKRAEHLLEEYEQRLGLVERFIYNRNQMGIALEHVTVLQQKIDLAQHPEIAGELHQIRNIIEKYIEQD
jgi:hypothetical protein